MVVILLASIVLPDPGAPVIRTLWAPAAAISSARLDVYKRQDDGSVNDNGLIRIAVGTFQIPSIRSHAVNHQCTALIAMDIRNLFWHVDQAVRLDVLAVRIVRTGKIPVSYTHLDVYKRQGQ